MTYDYDELRNSRELREVLNLPESADKVKS